MNNTKKLYISPDDNEQKSYIRSHGLNTIKTGELACLSIVLFDDSGLNPLANVDYQISGPDGTQYSGTTDDEGYLFHPDVPIDNYDLIVGDTTVIVPVVLSSEERHFQRVIDFKTP